MSEKTIRITFRNRRAVVYAKKMIRLFRPDATEEDLDLWLAEIDPYPEYMVLPSNDTHMYVRVTFWIDCNPLQNVRVYVEFAKVDGPLLQWTLLDGENGHHTVYIPKIDDGVNVRIIDSTPSFHGLPPRFPFPAK